LNSLSIVVPAFNEEKRLPGTLERIIDWATAASVPLTELMVVDDGSSDGTAALVESFHARHACVRLLRNPGNRGKGYAVRHGMLEARGEWMLYSDADLSTPIEDFDKLYRATAEAQAAVAIGSRALDRSLVTVRQSAFREYSGRFFNLAMRAVTGLRLDDTQCGFKLYRADAAQRIFARQKLDGFSFDVEDLYIAKQLGFKTVEVPVRWRNVEGTKVSLASGLKSFSDLVKIRLLHRQLN
jgi:dolichyl-phosphate beta-glucosyltransferase